MPEWTWCCRAVPKSEIVFFCQVLAVYTVQYIIIRHRTPKFVDHSVEQLCRLLDA